MPLDFALQLGKSIIAGIKRILASAHGWMLLQLRSTGIFEVGIGIALTFGVLLTYFFFTSSFAISSQILQAFKALSFLTVILIFLGVVISLAGFCRILEAERKIAREYVSPPSISVLAKVLGERKYNLVMVVSSIGYGLFYAAVSSMILYRPMQNFAQDYLSLFHPWFPWSVVANLALRHSSQFISLNILDCS